MIFVTGDIHAKPNRFSMEAFPEQAGMNRDDYVIICGDFGLVWDYRGESSYEKWWLNWLENKPFTTLFVDGNHENFDRLNHDYPVEEWNGGLTHIVRPHIRHLMRGEVFTLQNHTFFAFGGARSHDIQDGILDPTKDREKIKRWSKDRYKMFRVNHQSWWKEEMPTAEEMQHGRDTLEKYGNKVDFIITHDRPSSLNAVFSNGWLKNDDLNRYLEEITQNVKCSVWFYGHHHDDRKDFIRYVGLYEQIVRIL